VLVGQCLSLSVGPGNVNIRSYRGLWGGGEGTAFISVRTMNDLIIALLGV
jgi:hypothetical protein